MSTYIVREKQIKDYISYKKNMRRFNKILNEMHNNSTFLNESVSIKNANQSLIDLYKNNGLFNDGLKKILIENYIIDENDKII